MISTKKIIILGLLVIVLSFFHFVEAQRIGTGFLFRPGVHAGAEFLPPTRLSDSTNFAMSRYYANFVVPIGGKVGLDIKNLSLTATQSFLTINAGVRRPQVDYLLDDALLYNLSLGITGVKAGLFKGVWFYTANVGFVQESSSLSELHPFGIAALAKVKVRGIHKHDIYGAAVLYQYRRFLPVPIFGLNRKLSKKVFMQLLLPVSTNFTYKFNKKFSVDWLTAIANFRTGVRTNPAFALPPEAVMNPLNMNYTQIKSALIANIDLSKRVVLQVEGGLSFFRNLYLLEGNNEYVRSTLPATPYLGASFRIDMGKSLIGSQLFGNDF
ncbi:MAG: hypothetical protein JJT94_14865 [Bernardetiaceae bacterium]|nr:hypothetical protein [Bernardetiaceae bacterium]